VHLVLGILVGVTGIALTMGQTWARVVGNTGPLWSMNVVFVEPVEEVAHIVQDELDEPYMLKCQARDVCRKKADSGCDAPESPPPATAPQLTGTRRRMAGAKFTRTRPLDRVIAPDHAKSW
jgi:hypothetical protein